MPLQPRPGVPKNVLRLGFLLLIPGAFALLQHGLIFASGAYPNLAGLAAGTMDIDERGQAVWHLLSLGQALVMVPAGIGLLMLRAWGWWTGMAYAYIGIGSAVLVMVMSVISVDGGPAPVAESVGPMAYLGLLLFPIIALVILRQEASKKCLLKGELVAEAHGG